MSFLCDFETTRVYYMSSNCNDSAFTRKQMVFVAMHVRHCKGTCEVCCLFDLQSTQTSFPDPALTQHKYNVVLATGTGEELSWK